MDEGDREDAYDMDMVGEVKEGGSRSGGEGSGNVAAACVAWRGATVCEVPLSLPFSLSCVCMCVHVCACVCVCVCVCVERERESCFVVLAYLVFLTIVSLFD
jgi:hypothetical protein